MDLEPILAKLAQAIVVAVLAAVAGGQVGLGLGQGEARGTYAAQEASNAALQSVIAGLAMQLEECEGKGQ